MSGVSRIDLVGHMPHVECRPDKDRGLLYYFVCFEDLGVELVMGFEEKLAAREIAVHVFHGSPFFTAIPVVPYQTPYPRPWLVYPDTSDTWRRISMRVVNAG